MSATRAAAWFNRARIFSRKETEMNPLTTTLTKNTRRVAHLVTTLAWISCAVIVPAREAASAATYQDGSITNMTLVGDSVFIMLNSGLPDNCAGTPAGWMIIPGTAKAMSAFVLGLWMRGDASQVTLRVFTSGITGTGYCEINQIDPAG